MTLSRTEHTRLSQNLRAKKWARIGWQHLHLVLTAKAMFMNAYIFQHGEVFEFPGFAARVCGFKLATLTVSKLQIKLA